MKEFTELIKENTLFQFYSWMRLAVLALYLDLFSGITMQNKNIAFATLADVDISFIIFFILISAAIFPLIVMLILVIHNIALLTSILICTIKTSKIVTRLTGGMFNQQTYYNLYDLSFKDLMDYALKENNDIFYNLAIKISQEYRQMKMNRYITTAAILLLCLDINHGAILSNIDLLTTDIKYFIYAVSVFICYILLHKIALYNAGAYETYSKDIYDKIKNT